uniref:Pan3_PK domain-containing protein n=1 Tax=Rhabditophanes sp. KR3021 TaxID=114890 RepID=A0AC35TGT3_9BILA
MAYYPQSNDGSRMPSYMAHGINTNPPPHMRIMPPNGSMYNSPSRNNILQPPQQSPYYGQVFSGPDLSNNFAGSLNISSQDHSNNVSRYTPYVIAQQQPPPVVIKPDTKQPPPTNGNGSFQHYKGTTYFYHPQNEDTSPNNGMNNSTAGGDLSISPPTSSSNDMFSYSDLPQSSKFGKTKSLKSSFFMSEDIHRQLNKRQMAIHAKVDPLLGRDIPSQVEHYRNLVPLDNGVVNVGNQLTSTFKCFNSRDNLPYCLKRLHKFRSFNAKLMGGIVEGLKKVVHANIIQLKEVVPSRAFNDHSLILIYDFYPMAESLRKRYFSSGVLYDSYTQTRPSRSNPLLAESLLWNIIIQMSDALRHLHSLNMAARSIDIDKVLIYGESRILLDAVCEADIVGEPLKNGYEILGGQHEDLFNLGRMMLQIASGNLGISIQNMRQGVEFISQQYSPDLINCIQHLLFGKNININDLMPMIGARYYGHINAQLIKIDTLENELTKEMENGRVFRILAKLNSINERPFLGNTEEWSETGERYMLKLFRDYCFHQVNEVGLPWLDMAHIISCLNKLEAGDPEKIQMVSRDGKNLIIIGYDELKKCMVNSFNELVRASRQE